MRLVAEFTSEPFRGEGETPAHVLAAFEAAESAGLACDLGPLGTRVEGDGEVLVPAISQVLTAAFAAGATRVQLSVGAEQTMAPTAEGGQGDSGGADREAGAGESGVSDAGGGLPALLAELAAEHGAPLDSLPRAEKQRAVRILEERGAFEYRRSAETIAEALGVTRFTVYNYLNRSR